MAGQGLDAGGRGWGWSPGCKMEGRGLKVLGTGGWGELPRPRGQSEGPWGWESPWGDPRDCPSCRRGRPVPWKKEHERE